MWLRHVGTSSARSDFFISSKISHPPLCFSFAKSRLACSIVNVLTTAHCRCQLFVSLNVPFPPPKCRNHLFDTPLTQQKTAIMPAASKLFSFYAIAVIERKMLYFNIKSAHPTPYPKCRKDHFSVLFYISIHKFP